MHSELMLSPSPSTSGTAEETIEANIKDKTALDRPLCLSLGWILNIDTCATKGAEDSRALGPDHKLTCVLDGEVRLALHGGGQLVHAQRQLSFEGRSLLTEGRESSEGALPGDNVGRCMSAWYRLGSQGGHGERRGGRGGW